MKRPHILIVEDDRALGDVLRYNVEQAGCDVTLARDGYDGLRQATTRPPDLMILDLMLPVMDGMEVCRQLRSRPDTATTLVLMLTAKSEESDQIVGFSLGADDYVTKPFSVRLLLERMKALLRRRESRVAAQDMTRRQGITIDRVRHLASVEDAPIDLTPTEFRLLDTLMKQPGRAFTRDELIKFAMGEQTVVLERTIDVHIRALRKKLGHHGELVETVRGVGYRFRERSEVT